MRVIDADSLRHEMYVKTFMEDSNMQRWDSGCWIRYKMFENCIKNEPCIQCKDCINWQTDWDPIHGPGHYCSLVDLVTDESFYCGHFERG